MGVPITFLDKYNPDQFEILGLAAGRREFSELSWPVKRYDNPVQHNLDGTTSNGSKANTGPTMLVKDNYDGIYYTADNANGKFKVIYARILIRKKQKAGEE